MKQYRHQAALLWQITAAALLCLLTLSGCSSVSARGATETVSAGDTAFADDSAVSAEELIAAAGQGAAPVIGGWDSLAAEPAPTPAIPKNWMTQSPYYIVVYKGSQSTVVYGKDDSGQYTETIKVFTCSTGANQSPTWTGRFAIRAKYRWRYLVGGVYGQYSSSISDHYLFHSVPYYKMDPSTLENEEYDKLGSPASKGCIRMCVRDCKWIYDNCPIGTEVNIVDDSGPAGPGVPSRSADSRYDGWDPSDKWSAGSPYFNQTLFSPEQVSEPVSTDNNE